MAGEQLVLLRTSERSDFTECRQKWQWAYVERLKPIRARTALSFGDLVHQALAAYYVPGRKRRGKPALHFEKIYTQFLKDGNEEIYMKSDDDRVTAMDLGTEMLKNYWATYGKDERYEVISSEQTFQIDVYDPDTGKYLFTYVGTFDGIWRDLETGRILFLETKTGASLRPFGAPMELDEQAGSYWAFGPPWLEHQGILKPGQKLDGILYNRLRKAFADTRPKNAEGLSLNKNGSVSKKQPEPLFKRELTFRGEAERAAVMYRAMHQAREMRLVKAGKLAVYKHTGQHCGWCSFRDMCEVHETGTDWEAMRDNLYRAWDPYSPHEIELEKKH